MCRHIAVLVKQVNAETTRVFEGVVTIHVYFFLLFCIQGAGPRTLLSWIFIPGLWLMKSKWLWQKEKKKNN